MHLLKWSAYYLFLIIVSTLLAINIINKEYGLNSFLLWLLLILLLLFPPLVKYIQTRINHQKRPFQLKPFLFKELEILFVAIICILPGLIAIQTPKKLFFHGDEAIISRNAEEAVINSLQTGEWNIFGYEAGTLNDLPAIWYVIQGIVITSLGPSVVSVKTFSLVAHLGIVVTQFILISKFFNKSLAWAWVLFYSSFPLVIHFSITGYQNLHSTFFAVLSVALALFATSTNNKAKKNLLLTASGVIGGIGMYFYLASILIPAYLFIVLFLRAIISHSLKQQLMKNLLSLFIPFLLVSLPYLLVSVFDYNFIAGRSSVFSAVVREINASSVQDVVLIQLQKSFLPYVKGNFTGDGEHYVNMPAFVHPSLAVITIIGALGILNYKNRLLKNQRAILISMTIIILITIFFGSIMTINPPAVHRILTVFPFLTFITIYGLNMIFQFSQKLLHITVSNFLLIFLVIIVSYFQLSIFFTKNVESVFLMTKNNGVIQSLVSFIFEKSSDNKELVLITRIPSHMNDQIFYYSNGRLNPQPIDSELFDFSSIKNISEAYLLLDDPSQEEANNIRLLKNLNVSNIPEIWSQADLNLFKLNYFIYHENKNY